LAAWVGDGALLELTAEKAQSFILAQHALIKRRSFARLLSSCRRFYALALRDGRLMGNPFADVDMPKLPKLLPKSLSVAGIAALLAAPDRSDPIGARDAAMLELMYACGLRVSELVSLTITDVIWSAGAIRCFGKGAKERMVPMATQTLQHLEYYVQTARLQFANAGQSEYLFLSQKAGPMTRQGFWQRVKHYAEIAGLPSSVSPHGLRHAFATHLVDNDADLRVVQLLLGHSSLSTTQIYTHVAKARLKSLHQAHHPRG
ncbi:MAG: site-specific tyrosine recombinase XerD, partial [Gammaproteobacteria bacterium]|nr:site-specific tyrosine recombinase XerD [Gammaproteobacteria bacterium]